MNQYIFIIHIMNLLLHFLHFFNTFQCIRCRNCTIDFVSYKCLFRSLIVRLWTGVVLDMLCLQKNRGRNWGIFDPNDFLKLFLKRMDFNQLVFQKRGFTEGLFGRPILLLLGRRSGQRRNKSNRLLAIV